MGTLLVALGLLLGFGSAEREVERFERIAAEDIASRLEGPDKRVEVEINPNGPNAIWGDILLARIEASHFEIDGLPLLTQPELSKDGRLRMLEIDLTDFELAGLQVQSLHARIPDCRYDFGLATSEGVLRLSRSGTGRGEVRVTQEALADYVVEKYAEIESATVRIERDHAIIEGTGDFIVARGEFAVYGKLRPVDGTRIELYDAKIYFDWVRAGPQAVEALLAALNPVIDLNADLNLHGAIHVEEIRLRDGVLFAAGSATIPPR